MPNDRFIKRHGMRLSDNDLWQIRWAMQQAARSYVEKAATAKTAAMYSAGLLNTDPAENESWAKRFMESANQCASLYDRVVWKLRAPDRKGVTRAG